MEHQIHRQHNRDCQQQEIDEILSFICQWALRQDLLEFAGGHQAARERQRAEDHLHRQDRHHEARNVGGAQIKLGRPDEGHAQRPERVAQRGSLRDCGHLHAPKGNADDRAQNQRDGDPLIVDDAVVEQGSGNCEQHAHFAGPDAVPRGGWRTHPFQRQDE